MLGEEDDDLSKDDSWEKISSDIEDELDSVDEFSEEETEDEKEMSMANEADQFKVKMLNVEELLDLFMTECPKPLREKGN
jgi:hypothetical protein